jgi:hypothetical protein
MGDLSAPVTCDEDRLTPLLRRMAEPPDISRQRRRLSVGELRSALRWHCTAKLLGLRHALVDHFQYSGETAVTPHPLFLRQIWAEPGTRAVGSVATAAGPSAHLAMINASTERNHICRRTFGDGKIFWCHSPAAGSSIQRQCRQERKY